MKNTINIMIGAIVLMAVAMSVVAKPVACNGVSKKCTENVRFDKTIEGQEYSCYECKQTVCKSAGSGPIAGTETTSVCESIAPTGRALIKSNQQLQFDEADALFGRRTEVKETHPTPSTFSTVQIKSDQVNRNKTIDHRKNSGIKKKPERGTKGPLINKLKTPTKVTLYDVTNNSLSISWVDNANNEYGVSVERGMPENDRGGINYNWQHLFNVEERIDSNVKGTGWRTDGDDELTSDTEYCYRLKAYHKTDFSEFSSTVCVQTE